MISSRYGVAVHILTLVAMLPDSNMSSEDMADSLGVHPVVVRSTLGQLKKAGLVTTRKGVPGSQLTRPMQDITLLEVFNAVLDKTELFSRHQQPNPNCPVGRNIQGALERVYHEATEGMKARLGNLTLAELVHDMARQIEAS